MELVSDGILMWLKYGLLLLLLWVWLLLVLYQCVCLKELLFVLRARYC